MKKWFKICLLIIFFFILKDKALGYSFESVEGDYVSGNIFCGPYYNYNESGGDVIFLKFVGSEYYVNSLNSLTGVVTSGGQTHVARYADNKVFSLSSCGSCPLFISTDTIGSLDNTEFKMLNNENEGSGKIFTMITDDQLLKCTYKFKYRDHEQEYDFYYSNVKKPLIIPDIKNNDYSEKNIVDFNLASDWNSNGITVVNGKCPSYIGDVNLNDDNKYFAKIHSALFDYDNLQSASTLGKNSCGNLCDFYNEYLNNIEYDYSQASTCDKSKDEYCDSVFLEDADLNISNIKVNCSNIYSRVNAGDQCVVNCLNFPDKIIELKKKYNINDIESACGLSSRILGFIANVMKWIKYIAPVLAIILGILDFVKAIAAQNDDDMKKAQGKFVKRLIAAALLFIVPFILEFLLEKFNVGADYCNII